MVIWIDTRAHPAQMIYLKWLYGIPAMLKIEGHGMRCSLLSLKIKVAVAVALIRLFKCPAIPPRSLPWRLVYFFPESLGRIALFMRFAAHLGFRFLGMLIAFFEKSAHAAFTFRSLSQRRVLHAGHIFGVPSIRCAHSTPHLLHLRIVPIFAMPLFYL
jgi:hypothetical protein